MCGSPDVFQSSISISNQVGRGGKLLGGQCRGRLMAWAVQSETVRHSSNKFHLHDNF